MNDVAWQYYTREGNEFFRSNQQCCALSQYNNALTEAKLLLMHSFDFQDELPVVPILLISYQNILGVYENVLNIPALEECLISATQSMSGILKSTEFPNEVRESCSHEIHRLYHNISSYCGIYPEITENMTLMLKEITDVLIVHSQQAQHKKGK